jgi:PAS domain S-box-containing protein
MDPTASLRGAALRPPGAEREYRERTLREDGRTAALAIGLLTVLLSSFVLSDGRFVTDPAVLRLLLSGRFAFLVLSAGSIWMALRARRPAVLDVAVLLWGIGVVLLSLGVQWTRPVDYYLPLGTDIAMVVLLWTVIPNRFAFQALAGLAMTVQSLAVLFLLREPLSPTGMRLVLVGLAGANFVGALLSWRAHRSRRSSHLEQRELAATHEALEESEEKYRTLVDNLHAGFVVHAPDTSIVLANARAGEMLGLNSDQMRGKVAVDPAWRFLHEDGTPMPPAEYPVNRVIATGRPVVNLVIGVDRPASGDRAWVLANAYPAFREPGSLRHVVVTFIDITQRMHAQEAMRRSEALRRTVMENFPNGIVGLFGHDLRYVLVDGTNTVDGTDPRTWQAKTPSDHLPRDVVPMVESAYRAALAGESSRVRLAHTGRLLDVMIRPVRNDAGEVILGLFMSQDVTEKVALEAQLAVTSRLASLGTLVTGVAHEINNPLTGELAGQGVALEEIGSLQEDLRSGRPVDREDVARRLAEVQEALRDAQAGGERIARIVKDLSLFGRPDPRRARVRLVEVVDEAMRWLPASLARTVTLRVEHEDAPDVMAARGQIGQVVVNLVTNAAKAVPEGRPGVVTIKLGRGAPGMARLEVHDDGIGIPPEVAKRIFDPFFTTRQVGQGTGLGLPICHSIVTAHGGTIVVRSLPGEGSVFRVELPVAAGEA